MESPQHAQVHHKCNPKCENAINQHINLALHNYYIYLSMAYFLDREDVALKRYSKSILCLSSKAREQAEKLMELQTTRGGVVRQGDIQKPDRNEWDSSRKVLNLTMSLEKGMNESLCTLYRIASEAPDVYLCDFLRRHLVNQQVQSLKELGDLITMQHKLGSRDMGIAVYLLDNLTLNDSTKN
ncbi:ferritin heavy chain-like [Erinaceus europaeus]|uniref:Ferritin n=1 Tax=Erinaceus europaeus TaxID=9365 RepID=A0ABM3WQ13_ERIEU|nr:ferritin heavy chain-like [Erinaceus europaeus]